MAQWVRAPDSSCLKTAATVYLHIIINKSLKKKNKKKKNEESNNQSMNSVSKQAKIQNNKNCCEELGS